MVLVWTEPSTFSMGSPKNEAGRNEEETLHRVTLTRGFYMSAHLVTQYQWEQVMGRDANPSHFRCADEEDKKRQPVDSVSWDDCQKFCALLSKREGRQYRLPTEAQWEYACRAGSATAYWWGNSISPAQANYDRHRPTPVGQFPPNAWGLYDMHGNLWQWCEDRYGTYQPGAATDPVNEKGLPSATRVLRGGSWRNGREYCRSASRDGAPPDTPANHRGCRVIWCPD
jgi:formylglycine-generating enzyme required for sulfatase activity